jgi:hypothetical protein
MYPGAVLVKEGVFLYDGTVPCSVKIFKHYMKYGSGNHEDPPDIQNDLEGEYYYIGFGSTTEKEKITSGSMALNTLEEAILEAQAATKNGIVWAN